jgi:hypothetical protein
MDIQEHIEYQKEIQLHKILDIALLVAIFILLILLFI